MAHTEDFAEHAVRTAAQALGVPDLDPFDRVAERVDTAPGLSPTQRGQLHEVHRDLATRFPVEVSHPHLGQRQRRRLGQPFHVGQLEEAGKPVQTAEIRGAKLTEIQLRQLSEVMIGDLDLTVAEIPL